MSKNLFFKSNIIYLENEDMSSNGHLLIPSSKPIIIFIQANFCPNCNGLRPLLQMLADNLPNIIFATILIDGTNNEKELGKRLGGLIPNIIGVPTIVMFNEGKYVKTYKGNRDLKSLQEFITHG